MWHNETMEFQRRLDNKFDKGILHGSRGFYKPGLICGALRVAYLQGHKEGKKMFWLKNQLKTSK